MPALPPHSLILGGCQHLRSKCQFGGHVYPRQTDKKIMGMYGSWMGRSCRCQPTVSDNDGSSRASALGGFRCLLRCCLPILSYYLKPRATDRAGRSELVADAQTGCRWVCLTFGVALALRLHDLQSQKAEFPLRQEQPGAMFL